MKIIIKKHSTFFKYVVIGVIGTILNIAIYMLLVQFFNEQYLICNIIAYIFSLILIFILNKKYVFNDKANDYKFIIKQFIFFSLSRVVSLGIDTLVLYLCIDKFYLGNLLSKIMANISTTFLNYFVGKLFIFKKPSNY